ncbi:VanW family protein [Lewinella sp. 4G2]|uniref:VanW family protein n=1 Tax=Lewinella sp. 4G2 TaxID=1803372 RepID=UPI0007B4E6A9|nr:VanW family protein [Lewinella sp. 4G2]OAV44936.1 hypothetical protein A3850_010710 [Lewinella sp. 4G2]
MMFRAITPRFLKIAWQLARRKVRHRGWRFAQFRPDGVAFPIQISLCQPIRPSSHLSNKVHNLRLASTLVEAIVIHPGEAFSFWHCVGPPTKRRGYLPGRNLIAGRLREDYGGGLCQLSGILYHLALLAGLEIVERHHHSVDSYREAERFTPLGSDATVVYGYRDLIFRNRLSAPIHFLITVADTDLTASLCCLTDLTAKTIYFRRVNSDTSSIEVISEAGDGTVLAHSVYQRN